MIGEIKLSDVIGDIARQLVPHSLPLMVYRVIADRKVGSLVSEGQFNPEHVDHFKECTNCREAVIRGLRAFADKIESGEIFDEKAAKIAQAERIAAETIHAASEAGDDAFKH